MNEIFTTCVFCDGGCAVKADVPDGGPIEGGDLHVRPANPAFPALCGKAHMIDAYRLHPDRLAHPLKNVGTREAPAWKRISWDEALDEIADRLSAVIEAYGPESLAVSEMPLNHGFGGITRRLMNHLGSPNYISGLALCMGNTAQVHRAVYGWFTSPDWTKTDCIMYFGQNRGPELWPGEYLSLRAALERGATLVVIDPRETETAKLAQHHLRIRYGTDAALALGWINVIIEEELYDHTFVSEECSGFDELRERAAAWTPERVARICGIDADVIRETARLYARAEAAIIPWGVVPDMQVNSTALIQAQCILRAICGFVNVSEYVVGPSIGGITNAELADFGALPEAKRRLQLGADRHPLLTFRASALYRDAMERAGIPYEPDILTQSTAADPASVFAAMRGEGPYPVKAFFAIANNTVMSYANQQGIIDGLRNQDLVVAFENWMTPTAQLADYVLPGDMWAERDVLGSPFDVGSAFSAKRALRPRAEECRSWYFVVKELANRLGLADAFPWADEYALYDERLAPLGLTWDDLCADPSTPATNELPLFGSPRRFGTPSGKVELASSVLADLDFDPLPAYREPADPGIAGRESEFPYVIFAGARECANYNTNLRQMPNLRARTPEPQLFVNPSDAAREQLREGEWCAVETAYGRVQLQAHLDEAQPAGTLRVPHGWWKPETAQGLTRNLSGAWLYNDGMLFPDDDWNLDPAQGVPNLRGGIHARIVKL